jgi:2-oxoglutarate ferredoxin oxidoreductase subunit beta
MLREQYTSYLRTEKLPSVWCPGCGNGVIVKALTDTIATLGFNKDEIVVVGGIGCSGRTPFILDFNTMHTLHGRALAFATGIKLVRPELKVLLTMGDGDASGIGGNHFIHACRRNIDLTAIVFNNAIYGQTGGQLAPTTPQGKRSTTSQAGNIEPPFDLVQLALGAGAGFVARTTVFDFQELSDCLKRALTHKGFSLVEVLTDCPTYYGRMNELRDPYEMVHHLRETTIPKDDVQNGSRAAASERSALPAKLPTGIFRDEQQRPEYTELYRGLCEAAKAANSNDHSSERKQD